MITKNFENLGSEKIKIENFIKNKKFIKQKIYKNQKIRNLEIQKIQRIRRIRRIIKKVITNNYRNAETGI